MSIIKQRLSKIKKEKEDLKIKLDEIYQREDKLKEEEHKKWFGNFIISRNITLEISEKELFINFTNILSIKRFMSKWKIKLDLSCLEEERKKVKNKLKKVDKLIKEYGRQ